MFNNGRYLTWIEQWEIGMEDVANYNGKSLALARTGPPPEVFRKRYAPPGFGVPLWENLAQLFVKKLTMSGQVTKLWRHKRNNLRQFY